MAQRATSLRIPTPCAESWAAMTPARGGRHCAACQKTVVDFTQKTDAEILTYLAQATGRTCGRFRAGQLGPLLRPNATASRWRTWLGALAAAGGLAAATSRAAAQGISNQYFTTPNTARPAANELAASLPAVAASQLADTLAEIRGVVLDAERCEPLPGVTVALKNSLLGTSTNANGEFLLKLKPTEQPAHLVFSSIGFVGREQLVVLQGATSSRLEVALEMDVVGELLTSASPPWPWHARAFYSWGRYWLSRPFRH